MHDPWKVLGVDRSATPEEIKAAYRKLAKDHHPDKGGDPNRFIEIQNAYHQLTNKSSHQQAPPGAPNFEDIFGGAFEEMFSRFGFDSHFRHVPRNSNFEAVIHITVAEHIDGCSKTIEVVDAGTKRFIEVKIPKGVQHGDVLKYSGQGSHANKQAPSGDLFVRIHVKPYDDFEFHQGDLRANRTVTVWQALLGCKLSVADPYGKTVEFLVPAGCQPNTVMRIASHGGFRRDIQQRGDLLIQIQVQMVKLTEEQTAIINNWT